MSLRGHRGLSEQHVSHPSSQPVVHLELHTGDLTRAELLYAQLCGWRAERIDAGCGSYVALELGPAFGGGIVQCEAERAVWLPYVEVDCIRDATERARSLGAAVLVDSREGPAGWRSVVDTSAGGEIAFWQRKR